MSDFNVTFTSKDTVAVDKSLPDMEAEEVTAESDYILPEVTKQNTKPTSPTKEIPEKQIAKPNKEGVKPKALYPPRKN